MKKLVFFSHGLSANGIETFLVNVLKKIDKTKYDITVIIAIDEGVECLHEKTVTDMGIRVIHAGDLDRPEKKIAYIKNVKKILSSEHFDIAHSNMDLLNGITLSIAKSCGIPMRICHAHNSKSQYALGGRFTALKKTVQRLYYAAMKCLIKLSSTELLACSDVASKYFYGDKKSMVIYNGIDTAAFIMPSSFDRAEYRRKLGVEENERIVVSVGRFSMQKNPKFAIEIAAELSRLRDDFKYIWVGGGELETEARQKAEELNISDRIIFTGVRTDVKEILACCDCFLMPSLFEGLPFSLIEAQAAGLPCLVSDVVTKEADVGLTEYIPLEYGAVKWAELVNQMLDKPKKTADANKIALFDIGNTVCQLEQIYDKQLG